MQPKKSGVLTLSAMLAFVPPFARNLEAKTAIEQHDDKQPHSHFFRALVSDVRSLIGKKVPFTSEKYHAIIQKAAEDYRLPLNHFDIVHSQNFRVDYLENTLVIYCNVPVQQGIVQAVWFYETEAILAGTTYTGLPMLPQKYPISHASP